MNKKVTMLMIVILSILNVSANAQTDSEILFREIPWGSSYTDVQKALIGYTLHDFKGGKYWSNWTTDEIGTGEKSDTFEYNYINMSASIWDPMEVAGYKTEEVDLFFAYLPIDGILTHDYSDTAFYGARYSFKCADVDNMEKDLIVKLSSLYGDIDAQLGTWDSLYEKRTGFIWGGANKTAVVLMVGRGTDPEWGNTIWISYLNFYGDDWLVVANEAEREKSIREERQAAESGDTSGL